MKPTTSTLITSGTMTAGEVTNPSNHGTVGQVLTTEGSGELAWTTVPPATPESAVFLPTIVIGTQQWMRENLDVVTYRNGDIIEQVTDTSKWTELTTGAWCYYNNDPETGAIYGKLYNWYAVNDPRGLAPQGWHIPTDAEWDILGDKFGGQSVAGGKMKIPGTTTNWKEPNTGATNETGFTGLPGGYRNRDGSFNNVFLIGSWWSATPTQHNPTDAGFRTLSFKNVYLFRAHTGKLAGFSVRCLRD